jgi:hypothetical protein
MEKELERLTKYLHKLGIHPDYEYYTNAGTKPHLEDGWEPNVDMGSSHAGKFYWLKRKA